MTEEEWLTATYPDRLMNYFSLNPSGRKFRLFAAACCRRIWEITQTLPYPSSQQAVELAERLAEGLASDDERLRLVLAIRNESGTDEISRTYNEMARCTIGVGTLLVGKGTARCARVILTSQAAKDLSKLEHARRHAATAAISDSGFGLPEGGYLVK